MIGLDLAKQIFELHCATADGEAALRKTLLRKLLLASSLTQPACRVAMEACATAPYWAWTLTDFGHDVRLLAQKFVKLPLEQSEQRFWAT